MIWFRRYAIGCLIALFVFAAMDGYSRSDKDLEVGPIVALAALWPIAAAVFVDSFINEFTKEAGRASEEASGKPGQEQGLTPGL